MLMTLCFVFLGPLPFLDLSPTTGLIDASVGIAGVGYGLILVSSFGRAHRSETFHCKRNLCRVMSLSTTMYVHSMAMDRGYANSIPTSLVISGMWTASFHFGNFVGPTASGFMVEAWGFR